MSQYWVVGAMWKGQEDMLPSFLAGGYWYLGYTSEQDKGQNALRDRMVVGDRIAVKRMLGQGATKIEIRAIGVIKHVDVEDGYKRIYVNWVLSDLARQVPARGCFASVHGPYSFDDDWTRTIFSL